MGTVPSPHTFAAGEVVSAANINTLEASAAFVLAPPLCRVYVSGDRSTDGTGAAFAAATWQSIPFNAETLDQPQAGDTQMHDGSGAPSKITVHTAGTYLVGYSVQIAWGSGNQDVQTAIYKNGVLYGGFSRTFIGTDYQNMSATDMVPCAAGDYLEVYVSWSTSASVVRGYTGSSTFWAQWVSQ